MVEWADGPVGPVEVLACFWRPSVDLCLVSKCCCCCCCGCWSRDYLRGGDWNLILRQVGVRGDEVSFRRRPRGEEDLILRGIDGMPEGIRNLEDFIMISTIREFIDWLKACGNKVMT